MLDQMFENHFSVFKVKIIKMIKIVELFAYDNEVLVDQC